jgi:hypothetical protein
MDPPWSYRRTIIVLFLNKNRLFFIHLSIIKMSDKSIIADFVSTVFDHVYVIDFINQGLEDNEYSKLYVDNDLGFYKYNIIVGINNKCGLGRCLHVNKKFIIFPRFNAFMFKVSSEDHKDKPATVEIHTDYWGEPTATIRINDNSIRCRQTVDINNFCKDESIIYNTETYKLTYICHSCERTNPINPMRIKLKIHQKRPNTVFKFNEF